MRKLLLLILVLLLPVMLLSQAIVREDAPHTFPKIFVHENGTAAAPAISFNADPDNGLYRIGANNIGFAIGGTKVVDIGAAGVTFSVPVVGSAGSVPGLNAVTGVDALTSADCGRVTTVTAGIDTATLTLPEASTVLGCEFTIVYIGADGGALLDISPLDSDADGIEGSCTLAASVVTFSGTADADIGLTKATGLTGDYIKLAAVSNAVYAVTGCQGIWANN